MAKVKRPCCEFWLGWSLPQLGGVHTAKGLKIGYLEQHASLVSTQGVLWELALSAFAELRQQEANLHELAAALAKESDEARHARVAKTIW